MAHYTVVSKKVKLAEDVQKCQAVSFTGHLATTGSANEPAGITMYEGKTGEIIAVMCIGLITVPQDGTLVLGDMVKVDNGAVVKATTKAEAFATVCEVPTAGSVELLIT